MNTGKRDKFLTYYYLGTPAFFLVDYFSDVNIRVNLPASYAFWEYVYFGVCFLFGFVSYNRQTLSSVFALIESSVNILLLVLSVMVPLWAIPLAVVDEQPYENPFTPAFLVNFVLSGAILLVSFYGNPLFSRREV